MSNSDILNKTIQRYLEFPVNSERIDAEIQLLRENPDCKLPRFTDWEKQLPVERKIKLLENEKDEIPVGRFLGFLNILLFFHLERAVIKNFTPLYIECFSYPIDEWIKYREIKVTDGEWIHSEIGNESRTYTILTPYAPSVQKVPNCSSGFNLDMIPPLGPRHVEDTKEYQELLTELLKY